MDTIGIIGQGFVGTAVREGMKNHFQIETYDKFKMDASTCSSLREVCEKANIVFACLPTPMRSTGECDLSIIEGTVKKINDFKLGNIVVIKSTVIPGTTNRFNRECKKINSRCKRPR